MDYNNSREKLIIPEYGRNVQKLVEYLLTVEDREKRSNLARSLMNIMSQLHHDQRDAVDYKRKLWDHIHIISGYRLDVDGPYPAPSPDELVKKPERIPYPQEEIRFRPYGKNIAKMIEKASEFEDGPEKDALIKNIANHLKKSYLNWNRDSVNDVLIAEHLKVLSKGRLELSDDIRLIHTNEILARNTSTSGTGHSQAGKRKKYNPKNDKSSYHRDARNRKKN